MADLLDSAEDFCDLCGGECMEEAEPSMKAGPMKVEPYVISSWSWLRRFFGGVVRDSTEL